MKKIKLFAMAVAALLCGNALAQDVVTTGAYSQRTISSDGLNSTWNFIGVVTSETKINDEMVHDNGLIFNAGSKDKLKLKSDQLSCQSQSSLYFNVPEGAAGTITLTVTSSSDSRYFQLFVNGVAGTDKQRLWSKVGDDLVKKGPQSYTFTSDDLTQVGDSFYLHFKDNNTEMKVASFAIVLTSGNYFGVPAAYPFVKSFTMGEIKADVDTANHTISAELPYGADRADAIANAEVVMGGTAKTFSISGDVLTAIDSVDTGKNIDYDLSGIVVAADPSDDATLSMITIDGADLAGFDPATLNYQMIADVIPTVAAVANDPNAIAVVEQAAELPGAATITVTAQDGETKLVYSVTFTSVDKICGMIARATATGENKADYSGALAGTADAKIKGAVTAFGETGYKLNSSGNYLGINLTQGAFHAGDMVNVFITKVNNTDKTFQFFSSNSSADVLFTSDVVAVDSMNHIILPAEADGATSLYIVRTDANGLNPNIAYIEVVRDCEPKLLAFSLAGIDAEIDQEAKTVVAELPYGTVLEESDWDNAYTLNGAATDAEYNQEHTTLTVNGDDASVVYTLDITIAQSASDNANLSEITVNGKAIAGFRADSLEYAFELPNGTVDLPVIAAVAEDITAEVVIDEITALDQLVEIVVTAQDGVTVLTYKVQLSVASAPKYLYEAVFSNGAKGAIDNDAAAIIVPYLDGEAYPTLVSDSVTPGASAEQTGEDKILVTGSDESTKEFSIEFRALSAPSFVADTITFDGSESYIFAFYGWHAEKGVIFSKAVNDEGNMRITTGKTRVYMALPACYKVNLISGTGGARDIKVSLNGGEPAAMKTAAANAGMDILLSSSETNFLAIESNQTGGDGGFIKMVLTLEEPQPTKLVEAAIKAQAEKFMFKGAVYFRHNAKIFNMMGHEIRF
ncbi:MAG: hypothetical protein MJZ48_01260 [Paludibacteraceae bacterium]|nr:hypothetical protein [Paludibacteraceae bacterium]